MNQFAISMTILLALLIGGGYQAYRNAAQEVAAHKAHAEEAQHATAEGEKATEAGEKPAEAHDAKSTDAKPSEAKPSEAKPAESNAAAKPSETKLVAAKGDVGKGKEAFATSCQGCHGANGAGGFAPKLAGADAAAWTFAQFKTALAEGKTPARELSSQMPRFADTSDADLENLQAYIKSL